MQSIVNEFNSNREFKVGDCLLNMFGEIPSISKKGKILGNTLYVDIEKNRIVKIKISGGSFKHEYDGISITTTNIFAGVIDETKILFRDVFSKHPDGSGNYYKANICEHPGKDFYWSILPNEYDFAELQNMVADYIGMFE